MVPERLEISQADVIAFLEHHRAELLMLIDLMDDDESGGLDRKEIGVRLACIDALLKTHNAVGASH